MRTINNKEVGHLWKTIRELRKKWMPEPILSGGPRCGDPLFKKGDVVSSPGEFQGVQVKAYNGTTGPQDHLSRFRANVVMLAYPEEIICRCFLAKLESQACEWFYKLPEGSIHRWKGLFNKFLEHFAASKRQKLPYSHLLNVKIRKGEQLWDFISHWEEATDVQRADDQALVAML
ncbi:unnamed protein product [Cuscuta campestris]|uniref:Retrotransposon gag domain-containing protein n=1 Tax=Cuscuta campestris TaxID=132261 RepID=A0A484MNE1_9ASTE|nr:unnamed protein product [Cuscuta campestris]